MCFNNGIKHVTTTTYHPQPSHVERFHRNLKTALIAFHHVHHKDWNKNLTPLQIELNSAVHDSHKKTPSSLMLGHDLLSPINLRWEILPGALEDRSNTCIEAEWGEGFKSAGKNTALLFCYSCVIGCARSRRAQSLELRPRVETLWPTLVQVGSSLVRAVARKHLDNAPVVLNSTAEDGDIEVESRSVMSLSPALKNHLDNLQD
uniref:Integrase catalytic domain-containing protein n=1 Tax=Timema bartmani TaxID=61472 RepID=A0A7R9FCC0_9NEOP|nr:unnamed protein product [Timema bartmani]